MSVSRLVILTLAAAMAVPALQAAEPLAAIHGTCRVRANKSGGTVDLQLRHGSCGKDGDCDSNETGLPWSAFSNLSAADLQHEGADLRAVLSAEAGKLTCSGSVHDGELAGDFTFVPDAGFVARMGEMGFTGFNSEKLEAYTLLRIELAWIKDLKAAGVRGMTTDNIIALKIFHVDMDYLRGMQAVGYSQLSADQLIAERVQGVNPEEVKRVQALGFHPTEDELIQMRIFHITPEFIQRMQAKGLPDLTISKLVQVRIFKLAE